MREVIYFGKNNNNCREIGDFFVETRHCELFCDTSFDRAWGGRCLCLVSCRKYLYALAVF